MQIHDPLLSDIRVYETRNMSIARQPWNTMSDVIHILDIIELPHIMNKSSPVGVIEKEVSLIYTPVHHVIQLHTIRISILRVS